NGQAQPHERAWLRTVYLETILQVTSAAVVFVSIRNRGRVARPFLWAARFFCLGALLTAGSLLAPAQAANEAGVKPFSSFHGGSFEMVNLPGNKLEVRIPLLSYPQRGGLGLSFIVRWHNAVWNETHNCPPIGQGCFYYWLWDAAPSVQVVAEQTPPLIDQVLL